MRIKIETTIWAALALVFTVSGCSSSVPATSSSHFPSTENTSTSKITTPEPIWPNLQPSDKNHLSSWKVCDTATDQDPKSTIICKVPKTAKSFHVIFSCQTEQADHWIEFEMTQQGKDLGSGGSSCQYDLELTDGRLARFQVQANDQFTGSNGPVTVTITKPEKDLKYRMVFGTSEVQR